ncbi:Hypothetical predicted protein, partial [Olea europaea subsp. europaea]
IDSKGYTGVMGTILADDVTEKQRKATIQVQQAEEQYSTRVESILVAISGTSNGCGTHRIEKNAAIKTPPPLLFHGVFYRDLMVVGNLLSQAGLGCSMPMKYEALSC